jgi:hypothetical protein
MMLNISQRAGREVARTFSIYRALNDKEPIRRARPAGRKSESPEQYLEIKYICVKLKRSQPSAAPTLDRRTPVGAAEGCDHLKTQTMFSQPATKVLQIPI